MDIQVLVRHATYDSQLPKPVVDSFIYLEKRLRKYRYDERRWYNFGSHMGFDDLMSDMFELLFQKIVNYEQVEKWIPYFSTCVTTKLIDMYRWNKRHSPPDDKKTLASLDKPIRSYTGDDEVVNTLSDMLEDQREVFSVTDSNMVLTDFLKTVLNERQRQIVLYYHSHGFVATNEELAEYLHVTDRTIKSDRIKLKVAVLNYAFRYDQHWVELLRGSVFTDQEILEMEQVFIKDLDLFEADMMLTENVV